MKSKILISACLLGNKVRYDGQDKLIEHEYVSCWLKQGRLVSLCPEVAGGLPTPRPAAELHPDTLVVTDITGADVTNAFTAGAVKALEICRANNIQYAVLTESSPSCGSERVYDGFFSGQKIEGAGVTTRLLTRNGIQVFSQHKLAELANILDS